jgi:hypothetical protein
MIPANAIITVIREPADDQPGRFGLEVWGREPHDYVRFYVIEAKSDNLAAQEALARFSEEISALLVRIGDGVSAILSEG